MPAAKRRGAAIGRGEARCLTAVASVALSLLVCLSGCSREESSEGTGLQQSEQRQAEGSPQQETSGSEEGVEPVTSGSEPADDGLSDRASREADPGEQGTTGAVGPGSSTGGPATAGDTVETGESFPSEEQMGLRVARAYVCKGIEESEPTEAGRSFIPEDDGDLRLCCFSEIEGALGRDTIHHVWYWGDREMARVELEVRGPSWRTWSNKRIADEWRGEWRVDITDGSGRVLSRLGFSVE
jgi:hypothetical protein